LTLFVIFSILISVISCKEVSDKIKIKKVVKSDKNNSIIDSTIKPTTASNQNTNGRDKLKLFYIRDENRRKWYGFKDYTGNIRIPPTFKYAEIFEHGFARVYINEKWGLINKEGDYVVEPQYRYVSNLNNNFVIINKDGYWGYLDRKFKMRINPSFLAASLFKNGKAMVVLNEDSLALIDTLGNKLMRFSQFPDTTNNKFQYLSRLEINRILKPGESFGGLRKYIEKQLKSEKYDIYFMRKSTSDGEGYDAIVFQELKYGIKFYGVHGWESSEYFLRIPGISFEDGISLAIQLVGNKLRFFKSEEEKIILDMSYEFEHYIEIIPNEKGFIEIIEVSSS
jgi:hypothetical protein